MQKYKIMIIDDKIFDRIEYLSDFLTNAPLDKNRKLLLEKKTAYKKQISVEFEVIYPQTYQTLNEYIKENKVDAYFLDTYLEEGTVANREYQWHLNNALSAICRYNSKAPIFMYSSDWRDKDVLERVTAAFRTSFPGKTASYFYDTFNIVNMVENFREAVEQGQIETIRNERKFIKNVIDKAYGKTEKTPFSENGDIVLLHISDIQYGDKNTTKFINNLWAEVIRVCKELRKSKEISGIDLVAITGDVSMQGKSKEMEDAKADLEQFLFEKLWQDELNEKEYQERILFVPGNHDYDLNFCTLDYLVSENGPNKNDRKIDFNKASESIQNSTREKHNDYHAMGLEAYKDFAYSVTGNPVYYQKKYLNYVDNRYTSWGIRFICLNTCGGICADRTNGVGLNNNEIKEIANENYDDCYTVVLSHHSPFWEDELQGEEKTKFITDCKTVINSCGVNLWLGGHRHVQNDEIKCTSTGIVEIYEASTISLEEEWVKNSTYEVQTVDGKNIRTCRGFQIIILENVEEDQYRPKLIKYVFDDEGVAHRVRN